MPVRIGKMEGAGPYYGIPLAELPEIEWSPEEELEIERYCTKILKNISESGDDMTPMERFRATLAGEPRDRLLVESWFYIVYAVRSLDAFADAMKPIDCYRYPKLYLKAHLANFARYPVDVFVMGPMTYAEEIWGSDAVFLETGNPEAVGSKPIKTMADLEDIEVADPLVHSMVPQYLWAAKELRKIFAKYGIDKVLPMEMCFCTGGDGTALAQMMGYNQFLKAVRKEPDLAKRCVEIASDWSIKFGTAVMTIGKPDFAFM